MTTFKRFRTVVGEGCVVIDSEADYLAAGEDGTSVASCDLCDVVQGKIARITSYTVELR